MIKICTTCKKEKALTEFYNSKVYKDGKGYRCKSCDDIARKKHQSKWRDRERRMSRTRSLRNKYGITFEEYEQMSVERDHKCDICHGEIIPTRVHQGLVVDHCHTTNKVRGLLCHKCNQALGLFKDNIESLKQAVKYLEGNNNGN